VEAVAECYGFTKSGQGNDAILPKIFTAVALDQAQRWVARTLQLVELRKTEHNNLLQAMQNFAVPKL
jgi:hypothetical protein